MVKKLIYILLISVSICGCTQNEDSYEVYNDVLLEVIGTGRYHVPFNTIFEYDSITQEKLLNQYINEENRPIDNRKLIMAICDTISGYSNVISDISEFCASCPEQDRLLVAKFAARNSNKKTIDLKKLPTIGRYELHTFTEYSNLRDLFKKNKEKYSVVGFIRISEVTFNNEINRGCFYYSIVDSGGHGHPEQLIFVSKMNGKWHVTNEIYL